MSNHISELMTSQRETFEQSMFPMLPITDSGRLKSWYINNFCEILDSIETLKLNPFTTKGRDLITKWIANQGIKFKSTYSKLILVFIELRLADLNTLSLEIRDSDFKIKRLMEMKLSDYVLYHSLKGLD